MQQDLDAGEAKLEAARRSLRARPNPTTAEPFAATDDERLPLYASDGDEGESTGAKGSAQRAVKAAAAAAEPRPAPTRPEPFGFLKPSAMQSAKLEAAATEPQADSFTARPIPGQFFLAPW